MSNYTTDQLDQIDIDVHNYVMGYVYRRDDMGMLRWHDRDLNRLPYGHTVPQYTRDWNAMGEVIEAMRLDGRKVSVETCYAAGRVFCDAVVSSNLDDLNAFGEAEEKTMPLAVAIAALKAKGYEVKL